MVEALKVEIRIVWVGYHQEGLKAFEAALQKGYKIVQFITLIEEAFEKRSAGTRKYLSLCKEYGIPTRLVQSIKKDEAYQIIREAKPDLMVVLGWSEILPERLLDIPVIGTVGTHAAMLPHNRGSAPVNWAIIRGEKEGGNSLMWLDKEVDQGEIIDQVGFAITMYDTCATVYDKVAESNSEMLLRLIERLSNGKPTVMRKKNVTAEPLLPRRHPKDGRINWSENSLSLYNFVRALTRPYPGAFSYLAERKYILWSVSLLPGNEKNACPGKIMGAVYSPDDAACGVQVACGSGSLIIHDMEDEAGMIFTGRKLVDLALQGTWGDC